jgi:aquaporin Z
VGEPSSFDEKKGVTYLQSQSETYPVRQLDASSSLRDAIALHWPEYLFEGIELGLFMIAACAFGTLLFYSNSPVVAEVPSSAIRLVLMGLAMGGTAIAIILSPMGRRSGAHFNPAVSFTFFCLGKLHRLDAFFYIVAQFIGGAVGVFVARILLGPNLASSSVRYVVTVPGRYGVPLAFLAEFFMGLLTITVVLQCSNRPRLSRITWLLVGSLVTIYVIAFSSISGFSLNPARTVSSALFAGVWTAMWLYLSAPLMGMLFAASVYVLTSGSEAVLCAKIYHDLHSPCPFRCRFRHLAQPEPPASRL